MSDATPGQAAYGPYKVGDRVRVTGTIIGVNNSDADWVIVESHASVFTVEHASTNPDLALAAQEPHAAGGTQWRLVVNSTGEPASEPFGTEEEARSLCAELNREAGRPGWFRVRQEPHAGEADAQATRATDAP